MPRLSRLRALRLSRRSPGSVAVAATRATARRGGAPASGLSPCARGMIGGMEPSRRNATDAGRGRPPGPDRQRRAVAAPVRLPAPAPRARSRSRSSGSSWGRASRCWCRWSSPASSTQVVAGGDAAGLDRADRRARRAVPRPVAGRLRPVLLPGRGGGADRRPAAGRAVRAPRDALAGLPRPQPGRRARVAPVERRDPRPHHAHPDDDAAAVVAHRARRLGGHPVPAQPDAAARGPAPRAGADRRRHRLRAAAPARQHRGPGRDRPQHRHGGGGPGRDPRGQELRPRGLRGGSATARTWPGSWPRAAPRAVAGGVRGADGLPGLRRRDRPAVVHRPPGDRGHARGRHAHRLPALRDHDRRQPGDDRRPVRPVPRGDGRRHAGVRDPRHASRRSCDAPDAVRARPASPARSSSTACRFAYDGATAVLRDVNLDVAAGRDPGPGRAVGLGQDDPRRPAAAALGRDARARSGSTARRPRT